MEKDKWIEEIMDKLSKIDLKLDNSIPKQLIDVYENPQKYDKTRKLDYNDVHEDLNQEKWRNPNKKPKFIEIKGYGYNLGKHKYYPVRFSVGDKVTIQYDDERGIVEYIVSFAEIRETAKGNSFDEVLENIRTKNFTVEQEYNFIDLKTKETFFATNYVLLNQNIIKIERC